MGMLVGGFMSQIVPDTAWDLSQLSSSYFDGSAATTTYAIEVIFRTDGTVDILRDVLTDLPEEQNPYVTPVTEAANTWVQCTYSSGTNSITGPTLSSWHRLDTQRGWRYEYTSSGGSDSIAGTYIWKLSSDSSGSPVEATATITLDVGETF